MSDPRRIPRVRSEEVQLQPGSVLMYVYIYIYWHIYIYIYSKFSGFFIWHSSLGPLGTSNGPDSGGKSTRGANPKAGSVLMGNGHGTGREVSLAEVSRQERLWRGG